MCEAAGPSSYEMVIVVWIFAPVRCGSAAIWDAAAFVRRRGSSVKSIFSRISVGARISCERRHEIGERFEDIQPGAIFLSVPLRNSEYRGRYR